VRHACNVIGTCSTGRWTTRTQNTMQGDAATPLETGTRQRSDAEKQRAAEVKAARAAALAEQDREMQQGLLRDAQELSRCLTSGVGILTPKQVRQITCAVTGTNKEPMEVLRGLNERLVILGEENPQASSAKLEQAAESAGQALIAGAKNAKEQQRKPGPRQTLAAFEVLREALRLPESRRAAQKEIPGPPSGRTLRGAGSEVEQMHNYISSIGSKLHEAIKNLNADLIRSYRRALHVRRKQPPERLMPGGGTLTKSTACSKRWRSPRPHCASGQADTAGTGGRGQSQLGREGSLLRHPHNKLSRRGIRDSERDQMVQERLHGVPG
jgi:hypothetical protein